MDYTPVMFKDNVYKHLTTYSHELALSVIFESGWLHFAGGVEEYLDLPEAPKEFLKHVPVVWDETRFLAGEPGQFVVLARRSGNQWYIGGINGENAGRGGRWESAFAEGTCGPPQGAEWYIGGINGENAGRDVDVTLSFLAQSRCTMTVIEDGKTPRPSPTKPRP